jgi:prepilin-type processing-associated H-X9-DG protein
MRTKRHGITLVDVLMGIVVLALLFPSIVVVAGRSRDTSHRLKCASNLRHIGTALQLYLQNRGEWPRTRYQPETADRPVVWTGADSTTPFASNAPAANDVTAAYRLLLALEDLVSEVFLCPTSPVADFNFARKRFKREHANFIDERELSYSFANPYPTAAARDGGFKLDASVTAEFAVASDVNPGSGGVTGGVANDVTTVTSTSSMRDTRPSNSPNHDRDGQNVLYGDGHVDFVQNPFVGVQRDNIFTFGRPADAPAGYGVVGSPAHAADSVLLPTVDAELWRRGRAAQVTSSFLWVAVPALIVVALFAWNRRRRRVSLATQ